jgi:hypothetical protein
MLVRDRSYNNILVSYYVDGLQRGLSTILLFQFIVA